MVDTHSFKFDNVSHAIPDGLELRLYNGPEEFDWNLGKDGVFWLAGTMEGKLESLSNVNISAETGAFDEMILAVTGVDKTFYPLDDELMDYPMEVLEFKEGLVTLYLKCELNWDYYPAPSKPADYKTHLFEMTVRATVVYE